MTAGEIGNLLGIILSFIGACYAAKGLLSLDPRDILRSHPSHSGISHSLEDMTKIVSTRIEAIMGILYVFISLIIQIGLLSKMTWKDNVLSEMALIVITIVVISFILFINAISKKIIKKMVTQVNKVYLRDKINSTPERLNGNNFNNIQNIIMYADGYFSIKQQEEESLQDFMNRISDFVGAKHLY